MPRPIQPRQAFHSHASLPGSTCHGSEEGTSGCPLTQRQHLTDEDSEVQSDGPCKSEAEPESEAGTQNLNPLVFLRHNLEAAGAVPVEGSRLHDGILTAAGGIGLTAM